ATAERLTTEHIELHLQLAAERARQELVAAAARHGVAASFEIVRGAATNLIAAAAENDLVVAGALTRPIGRHFRVDCRWCSAVAATPGPFLQARDAGGAILLLLGERG